MRIFKNKPFIIKWKATKGNFYINRFNTLEEANKRIEFLKNHKITDIIWIKKI